jgi:hypothetical protein
MVSDTPVNEELMASLQAQFADGPLTISERETILRGVWSRADWDDASMDEYSQLISAPSRSLRPLR